jgi:hypothetical protein
MNKKNRFGGFFMSMEGRYVATVGNIVATMSMEGRYVATVGVISAKCQQFGISPISRLCLWLRPDVCCDDALHLSMLLQ